MQPEILSESREISESRKIKVTLGEISPLLMRTILAESNSCAGLAMRLLANVNLQNPSPERFEAVLLRLGDLVRSVFYERPYYYEDIKNLAKANRLDPCPPLTGPELVFSLNSSPNLNPDFTLYFNEYCKTNRVTLRNFGVFSEPITSFEGHRCLFELIYNQNYFMLCATPTEHVWPHNYYMMFRLR